MPNQLSDIDKELEKAELELSQPEPEQTPPVEETPEEEPETVEEEETPDTPPETVEEPEKSEESPDTEKETAEPHPYDKQFADRGLGSQFRDVADLIDRESDRTTYIGSQGRRIQEQDAELAEYRRQSEAPRTLTTEEQNERFAEKPLEVMDENYVRRDDAASSDKRITALEDQAALDQVAIATLEIPELKNVASALRSGSEPVRGYNKHWDAMWDAVSTNPALKGLRGPGAVKVLFDLTKESVAPKKKPPVKKLSPERKAAASTNSGGKVAKELKPNTDGEYPGWGSTAEEIEKALKKRSA